MGSEGKASPNQRRQMIAEAAYFRAEKRGFGRGDPAGDWYEAEREVDERLRLLEQQDQLERLSDALAAATKKLTTLKRKLAGLSAEARAEWQQDAERLAALRDSLQPKVAELRQRGEHVGQRARQQAERIGKDLSELLQRLSSRSRH